MSIELISDIKQANGGEFPLIDSNDIKGGLYSVDTESEMNSIPIVRLKDGMLCWVKEIQEYRRYNIDSNTWIESNLGNSSSSNGLTSSDVIDNLTTINTKAPLSANQGYQLNNSKFDDVEIIGTKLSFIANGNIRRFVQLPEQTYTLPTASATQLGGIKVGAGLSINNGILSANGGGTADSVDWSNVQNKPTIPTKVSDLTNDSGFITSIPGEYITESELNSKGYLTEHQDISGKVDKVNGKGLSTNDLTNTLKSNYDTAYSHSQSTHAPSNAEANVQTDWNITDINSDAYIKNKPTIPTKTSQLTNDSGFITSVPSEYITETELISKNYITSSDIPTVPTRVSQLTNDSGYLTSKDLPNEYILPNATSSSLGGVIVGDGLSVNGNGVISSNHNNDIINNLKLSYDSSTGVVNLTYNNNIISSITIEVSKNTYSIVNNLNNATTNNISGNIEEGSSYSAIITANTGYTISSITVAMNGVDITSSVVSGNNINIPNVTGNIVITVNASVTTYTITNNLTNCTTNNSSNTISYNSSYSSVISVNSGYEISSIIVTMGGADISDTAVSGNNINISNVTGNIVITVNTTMIVITMYNITRNLNNCTIDNSLSTIESGSNYIATITANSGYTNLSINVIMGETDITSSVVRGNIINIPSVTGNISITARATQSSTEVVIDESLEILTSFNYINMTEGGYKVLYVKLSKQPTSNVNINISSSSSDLSLSKSSLTFTNTNWYTSQSVNIISSSDTNTIDETYQLTLSSSGLANKVVTIDVVDESNSGFEVLYNNGELISGASLSLTNATDNGTYITTNMNADESIIISGYKLNLNKNDKVHLLVGLATTDPASVYSIRSMQLGDNSANDISGSNMISEEAISKNLVNGKVDTYWTVASSLSNIELTFTGYFARVNIYKIYIERGN